MPTQMLAYLRLARLTDPALLAKVHQTFRTFVLPKSQPLFLSAPSASLRLRVQLVMRCGCGQKVLLLSG
jgi:hypothetical protein